MNHQLLGLKVFIDNRLKFGRVVSHKTIARACSMNSSTFTHLKNAIENNHESQK
jgi:hypothetical protein